MSRRINSSDNGECTFTLNQGKVSLHHGENKYPVHTDDAPGASQFLFGGKGYQYGGHYIKK